MQQQSPIPQWVRLLLLCMVACMLGGLFIAGAQPFAAGLLQPPIDKIAHACVFALLAIMLWYASNRSNTLNIFALLVLVGALDEWRQRYLPGRSADMLDLASDAMATGAVLMALCAIRDKR